MSANANSSRNSGNAGSDSSGRYGVSAIEAYKRSSIPATKPSQNEPMILHTPRVPKDNGMVKDK